MKIFQKARWLSLDITLGAVILLFFICELHSLSAGLHIYMALAIAIWSIYTMDHLRDARKITVQREGRHSFHQKYFNNILIALIVVLVIGIFNIYFLPVALVRSGLILTLMSVVYLYSQRQLAVSGLKELAIATGYTAGIFLFPATRLELEIDLILQACQLLLIALINTIVVANYDKSFDRDAGFVSIAESQDARAVKILLAMFFTIILGLVVVYSALLAFDEYQLFTVLASCVLIVVHGFPSYFRVGDRFRFWADAVFFIPLPIILIQ